MMPQFFNEMGPLLDCRNMFLYYNPHWYNPIFNNAMQSISFYNENTPQPEQLRKQPNSTRQIQREPLKQVKRIEKIEQSIVSQQESNNEEDQTFGKRKQRKDRNLASGILKAYINLIHSENIVSEFFEGSFQTTVFPLQLQRFRKQLENHFPKKTNYFRTKAFKEILLSSSQNSSFQLMFRLTLKKFLEQQFPLSINKNKLLTKGAKVTQLKKKKELLKHLLLV